MFKNTLKIKKMSVYQLCLVAMLIALTVILSHLSGMMRIGNISKLSVSFITVYISAALFGPFIGGTVGALADIISYVANPTGAYVVWFTLIEFVNGFMFGIFLYRKTEYSIKLSILMFKIIACVLLQFAVNILLRTYILMKLGFVPNDFVKAFIMRFPASFLLTVFKVPVIVGLEYIMPGLYKIVKNAEKTH